MDKNRTVLTKKKNSRVHCNTYLFIFY